MTWVKLCGMTRREDVEAAFEAGADAVGFVVFPGSPRFIDPGAVRSLVDGLGVEAYLVAVDADPGWLVHTAAEVGAGGVQPHGRWATASAETALDAGLKALVPVSVGDTAPDLSRVPTAARPLLDSRVEGLHGGTGRSFDWALTAGLDRDFVLAGGLDPDNVAEAVRRTGAWGVDAASGVESAPGIKDHEAMRRFVAGARQGAGR